MLMDSLLSESFVQRIPFTMFIRANDSCNNLLKQSKSIKNNLRDSLLIGRFPIRVTGVTTRFPKLLGVQKILRIHWYIYPLKYNRNLNSLIKFGLQIDIVEKLLPLKPWLISNNKALLVRTIPPANYQDQDIKQQSNDSKNALHISIASQNHRDQTNKWQYSPLLQFFVHMMLINNEKLPITDNDL